MILVAGVSSAGKTHTLERLVLANPRFRHVRASEVLRSVGRPLRPLTPEEAVDNQHALLDALQRAHALDDPMTLLDGHVSIETTDGVLPLPDEVFDQLAPAAIVVLEDQPVHISQRRQRRGLPWTEAEAARFLEIERDHANRQAQRLGRPIARFKSGEVEALLRWLASHLERLNVEPDSR